MSATVRHHVVHLTLIALTATLAMAPPAWARPLRHVRLHGHHALAVTLPHAGLAGGVLAVGFGAIAIAALCALFWIRPRHGAQQGDRGVVTPPSSDQPTRRAA